MKVLIAPNAFKGTITAFEAGEIIADELAKNYPDATFDLVPIADGGDGTCTLLSKSLGIPPTKVWSLDPFGKPVLGEYFLDKEKAYLDVSSVSGLGLIAAGELDARTASTYGTGLLINHAISSGAKEIILGLGGSATVDIGIGILQALGLHFLDEKGKETPPFSPDLLFRIKHIQRSPSIPSVKFNFLCDVRNYFFGEEGAIPIFGTQKGLKKQDFEEFENQSKFLLDQLYAKKKRIFEDQEGFGAAGGIAAGLSSVFESTINMGALFFFKEIGMEEKVKWADLIITGEGKYDQQSKSGKACYELMNLAKSFQKPVLIVTSGNEAAGEGFSRVLQLPDLDFESADFKSQARKNLSSLISKLKL